MSDFYEFEHECELMPIGVRFCKIKGADSSQFAVNDSTHGLCMHHTVLYGFRYCPYCGEKLGDAE